MDQDEIDALECATLQLSLLHHIIGDESSYDEKPKLASSRKKKSNRQKQMICDVCNETIKSMHYPTHLSNGTPVCCGIMWNQIICPTHLEDGTWVCCGCMRLKTRINAAFTNLGDGRVICDDCYSTAIVDVQQCEPLIRKCHEFFRKLNMEIWEEVPVFLVDAREMARLSKEEELVLGLTLTHEDAPTVTSTVTNCSRRGTDIITSQQPQIISGLRIAILFGLPRIMTGAILAHEMMHAWFELEGIGGELRAKEKEGICQVIGYKWLEWIEYSNDDAMIASSTAEEAQFQRNLIETFKFVAKMHGSYEYGEGFRDAQWAVSRFGLETTLDHIFAHKKLPEID